MVHHCNFNKYHVARTRAGQRGRGHDHDRRDRRPGPQLRRRSSLDKPEQALARLDAALAIRQAARARASARARTRSSPTAAPMLVPLKAWAREHGTLFHIHSAEEPKTTRWFTRGDRAGPDARSSSPSRSASSTRDTVLAHQVNCGPRDVEILARTGAAGRAQPAREHHPRLGHAAGDRDAGRRHPGRHLDRRVGLGRQPEHPRRGAAGRAVPEGAPPGRHAAALAAAARDDHERARRGSCGRTRASSRPGARRTGSSSTWTGPT